MKTTLQEVRDIAKQFADVEYYEYNSYPPHERLYDGFIHSVDDDVFELPDDFPCEYESMNEDEYEATILANCGDRADFADWYGDKRAQVLVVLFRHGSIAEYRENAAV